MERHEYIKDCYNKMNSNDKKTLRDILLDLESAKDLHKRDAQKHLDNFLKAWQRDYKKGVR